MSATTRPTVASAITPRMRRARSESRRITLLALHFQHVAGLPHGADERRPGGVELAAQVAHVRLDDVAAAAEVVVPHVLEDLRLREHAARVEHEEAQQVELGGGQLDRRLAAEDIVAR